MSSSGHQSSASTPIMPASLNQLLHGSAGGWEQALQSLMSGSPDSLTAQLQANPEGIAQLTGAETGNINQLENIATNQSGPEQQSQSLINELTSGPIGSSPATAAAMRAYNQNIEPTIASSISATGGGRGGDLTAALTQGQTTAYAPLVQQEVANREAGVGQTQALGQQESGDITTAMNASDLIRQINQSGLTSQFQDLMRRFGLGQQLTLGPTELLGPSSIGQHTNQSTSSGKF